MYKEIEQLQHLSDKFNSFHKKSIPLCAAENVISDFVKAPLTANYQERYIMGSAYDFTMNDNFIGSELLLPYYHMINELGQELFHARYTDARTLTGMNAANLLISGLCKPGDNIMILGKEWGGHASMRPTFERLGANVFEAPYCLNEYDFDYDLLNEEIREKNIKFLNIAPSDIILPHQFEKINDSNCIILFDYSQLLGLIAAGLLENPLDKLKNCVLYGGSHKTMPGPAHGIIMTNNESIFRIIDKEINPKYLRNVQTHQVVSLLHCLVEMKYFGKEYQNNTVRIANLLGSHLLDLGVPVVKSNGVFTRTHQLFLEMPQLDMEIMYKNAIKNGVTLNTKKKQLFHGGFGIRLGLQEISRYDWDNAAIARIAEIISLLPDADKHQQKIDALIKSMPPKDIKFTFPAHQH